MKMLVMVTVAMGGAGGDDDYYVGTYVRMMMMPRKS